MMIYIISKKARANKMNVPAQHSGQVTMSNLEDEGNAAYNRSGVVNPLASPENGADDENFNEDLYDDFDKTLIA